jgi:8-oxo-dGTP diphosphatase
MSEPKFTIRVYGILINEKQQALITDEIYQAHQVTKFPGGGLEFGEGPIDCLKRECMEEMGKEVEVKEHFYTTDFYQPSFFNKDYQVICIYYRMQIANADLIEVKQKKFDFTDVSDGTVTFRWIKIKDILQEEFTFENDRRVARMLYEKYFNQKPEI